MRTFTNNESLYPTSGLALAPAPAPVPTLVLVLADVRDVKEAEVLRGAWQTWPAAGSSSLPGAGGGAAPPPPGFLHHHNHLVTHTNHPLTSNNKTVTVVYSSLVGDPIQRLVYAV